MSVHLLKTKNESAARSSYPRLRATATEFVPDADKLCPLRIVDEKPDPLCPLVVTSPAFSSVKKWIDDQSSRKKHPRSRRVRRRQNPRSQNTQGRADWYWPPLHQPSIGPRNGSVLPFYHDHDLSLCGIATPILQAADPFHDQMDKINQQLILFNRNDDDSGTC